MFEPLQKTTEELQKAGQANYDAVVRAYGEASKSFQAIGQELNDYTKSSFENATRAWEQLVEAKSLERALENAGVDRSEVDYIIFATMTPDHFFPGSGPLLGAKLGIPGVPALDIRQQCAAMPYALQLANGLIQSKAASTILLVGAEVHVDRESGVMECDPFRDRLHEWVLGT